MQDHTAEGTNTAVITLAEADLKQAYWLIQRKATLTPVGLLKVGFLTILAAIGVGSKYLQGIDIRWDPLIAVGVVSPFVMIGLAAHQNGRTAQRIFAQQKSLHLPFTLSWTAEGFSTRSDALNVSLPWRDLTKVLHDGKVILLCESDARFHTIPRRCLSPPQQADLLRTAAGGVTRTPA